MNERIIIILVLIISFLLPIIKISYEIFINEYLFYPSKLYDRVPSMGFEEVTLPNGVTGWHLHNHPESKTLLYCHGNAGNISEWTDMLELIHSQKLNVFIFDYRGFGKSGGAPSIKCIREDGEVAYEYLVQSVLPENLVVWGESMGGVVALHIAEKYSVGCLVLAGTFTTPVDLAKAYELTGLLKFIANLIDINNITSIKKVASKNIPIAIIHSVEDDVIPYNCGVKLFEAIPFYYSCKQFIPITGSHAQPKMTSEDLYWLFEFCEISTDNCNIADSYLRKICESGKKLCPFKFNKISE